MVNISPIAYNQSTRQDSTFNLLSPLRCGAGDSNGIPNNSQEPIHTADAAPTLHLLHARNMNVVVVCTMGTRHSVARLRVIHPDFIGHENTEMHTHTIDDAYFVMICLSIVLYST